MPTASERTARYSESEKRLVYWLTSNQCRSVEVESRAEAEELVEDSGISQSITNCEFGDGGRYTVKSIKGRTPVVRADIYRDIGNTGLFQVSIVTARIIGLGKPSEHKRFEHDDVGSFGTLEEALACAENSLNARLTAEEFSATLKELGIRQKWLAERLGVAISTVNRWATGALPVAPYVRFVLELLRERSEIRDQLSGERIGEMATRFGRSENLRLVQQRQE
jgi:DNA-binding transcriptional regulator YiaG